MHSWYLFNQSIIANSQAVTDTLFNKLIVAREENNTVLQENQLLKIELENKTVELSTLNRTLLSTSLGMYTPYFAVICFWHTWSLNMMSLIGSFWLLVSHSCRFILSCNLISVRYSTGVRNMIYIDIDCSSISMNL